MRLFARLLSASSAPVKRQRSKVVISAAFALRSMNFEFNRAAKSTGQTLEYTPVFPGSNEMKEFDPLRYRAMVKQHQDNDDPLGWFDSIYTDAEGDYKQVFWADLEPLPCLLEWFAEHPSLPGKKAIGIGCGVGDDAEAMSAAGYEVTAFDIAPEAIRLCKNRYPGSRVNYRVEDLFNYPQEWAGSFDLVYECNTIQVLPGKYRIQARDAMVSLMAKDAHLLVSCRSRLKGQQEDDIPLPLDKDEIDGFKNCGLSEESFLSYVDTQTPGVPHFFACYKKLS